MLRSPPSTCGELLAQLVAVHRRLVQQAEDGELEHRASLDQSSVVDVSRRYIESSGPVGVHATAARSDRPGATGVDARGTARGRPSVRTLAAVPGRRSVVDYSLQRRAVLADVYAGRTGLFEVCDASPYLSRAAKYHGEATDVACPVCRKDG